MVALPPDTVYVKSSSDAAAVRVMVGMNVRMMAIVKIALISFFMAGRLLLIFLQGNILPRVLHPNARHSLITGGFIAGKVKCV